MIGSDGVVSLGVLRRLADQDAAFAMLDRVGKVLAKTRPVRPSDACRRLAQSLAKESGAAVQIAIELIRHKLIGQERLVRDHLQNDNSTEIISDSRQALMKVKSSEEIRRYELYGAPAYWRAWHELPVALSKAKSALKLFHSLQTLLTLNHHQVNEETKAELYCSKSLYLNETIPMPASHERIMRFKDFEITKEGVDAKLYGKALWFT